VKMRGCRLNARRLLALQAGLASVREYKSESITARALYWTYVYSGAFLCPSFAVTIFFQWNR
jgi:hypothetical protein